MTVDRSRVVQIERSWATAERRVVDTVARLDPSWGSTTFDLADGVAVLAGPGLFVNQVMAAGLTGSVTDADLDLLERRAADVGVSPALQTCEASSRDLIELLNRRGYEREDGREAVVHDLDEIAVAPHPFTIEFVDGEELAEWQEASAEGWGYVTPEHRAASDVYGAAAAEVDDPGLLVARDGDGTVVGAAMLRIEDGFATLGGMSTRRAARGRGVQSALIVHRLTVAKERGCAFAVSSAHPGGGSRRNLGRLGFRPSHTHRIWVKP